MQPEKKLWEMGLKKHSEFEDSSLSDKQKLWQEGGR